MAVREEIDVKERVEEKVEEKLERPRRFCVLMHNDDYTPMDFVVRIMQSVFNKPLPTAVALMLKVHHEGQAVCGVYPAQIAETKIASVHSQARAAGYPLLCTMEPEEGNE